MTTPAAACGSATTLDVPESSSPRDINEKGEVVGTSGTGDAAFYWDGLRMVPLPALGGTRTRASAINDASVIAGSAELANGRMHAVIWRNGTPSDLGTLGGEESGALGINEAGDVVGYATTASGEKHATLWHDGHVTDLAGGPGAVAMATQVTARRQVIGTVSVNEELSVGTRKAFSWQDGALVELSPTADLYLSGVDPVGADERGDVALTGHTVDVGDLAFLWSAGALSPLQPFGEKGSVTAVAMNPRGQVAGHTARSGFLWDHGHTTRIDAPDGATVQVTGLSPDGQVVGFTTGTTYRPFTWRDGTFVYLATESATGSATVVNTAGRVAAYVNRGVTVFETASCFTVP